MKYLWLILSVLLISCQDFDYGYTLEQIAYTDGFELKYGSIDPLQDWGFEELTRAVNTNSNQWGKDEPYKNLVVPNDITEEEALYVYNWFLENPLITSLLMHWSDFFIQYVAYSGIGNMDLLGCQYVDGTWEHINDFNVNTRSIKYITSAGTEAWSYRASHSNSYQDTLYNVLHLIFDVNGNHYDGWYVGFDYKSIKGDAGDKLADGYYNDWIVKVTPAQHYPTYRVMCEDLGDTFDFDFNDLVFDVYFEGGQAVITLQAAGGTLPLYIEDKEVHALFGQDIIPINVGLTTSPVVIFRVTASTVADITLKVKLENFIELTAAKGKAPQKICVNNSVAWTQELLNIEDKYPLFMQWVQNREIIFW